MSWEAYLNTLLDLISGPVLIAFASYWIIYFSVRDAIFDGLGQFMTSEEQRAESEYVDTNDVEPFV